MSEPYIVPMSLSSEDETYIHDWRLCGCDTCDIIRTEYEMEMGS